MDGYSLGILLKTLIASAGIKVTLAIVLIGGFFWLAWRAVGVLAMFFQKIIDGRDAERVAFLGKMESLVSTLMTKNDEQQQSWSTYQNAQVKALEQCAERLRSVDERMTNGFKDLRDELRSHGRQA